MPRGVYKHKPNQGFQKGHKIWLGKKLSKCHIKKLSEAKKGKPGWWEAKGLPHPSWNEHIGYRGIHLWINKINGKAIKCEHCGKIGNGRQIHWANIDHKYSRDIKDWISLCIKCHGKYNKKIHKNYVNLQTI